VCVTHARTHTLLLLLLLLPLLLLPPLLLLLPPMLPRCNRWLAGPAAAAGPVDAVGGADGCVLALPPPLALTRRRARARNSPRDPETPPRYPPARRRVYLYIIMFARRKARARFRRFLPGRRDDDGGDGDDDARTGCPPLSWRASAHA